MAEWLNAKVVGIKQWNEKLFSLQVDSELPAFKAGQFTQLGVEINGEIVGRPFSLVNSPEERPLEFYFIEVLGGELSSRLVKLQVGDDIYIAPRATGLLTLDQIQNSTHLYLVATGTGIGPFLSIIRTEDVWQHFQKVVLVHGVRLKEELTYQDVIEQIKTVHIDQFIYVPFVSREDCPGSLSGRIPQAILDGRFEQCTGLTISAGESQVMLCGNPEMVQETMSVLEGMGLKKHSRREPGQISIEKYW